MYNELQLRGSKLMFFSVSVFSLYPFSFTNIHSIENILWIQALAPIAISYLYVKLAINKKTFFPSGARLIAIAMLVLGVWAFIHYISNPLLSTAISGNNSRYGFRRYYEIFTGLCVFFYLLLASCHYREEDWFWKVFVTSIMMISLLVGYTRVITYFLGLEMPLMGDHFDYAGQEQSSGAYRIGGLTEAATTGVAALIAIYFNKRWTKSFFFFLCLFMILLVLSGGRTATFAILIVFLGYILFVEKEKRKNIVLLCLSSAMIILMLNYKFDLFSNQFSRLTDIEGGISVSSPQRYKLFIEMWDTFLHHPFLGKGIGDRDISWNFSSFQYENLFDGGHGAYMSILMLFGVGGAFFLIITLFCSISIAYTYLKKIKNKIIFKDECIIINFCLVSLCMLAVIFISEGSGYNNLKLFVLSGIVAGKYASNIIYREHT